VKTYVAVGIAVIWGVSYLAALATSNYTGFEASTPVMVIAAAWLLGTQQRNGKHGP
jgi:hypothetical protein